LRELTYEQQLSGQSWAQELATTLVDALKACDAARTAGAAALSAAEIETFTGRYRSGVQAGLALNPAAAKIEGRKGRTKQSSAFYLLQRLEQHEPRCCTLCTISLCVSSRGLRLTCLNRFLCWQRFTNK
jgi:transposase